MDYITSFILSLLSYFIISNFIYRLSNRKNWSYIFLGVIFISSFSDLIPLISLGAEFKILLLVFMSRILPVILAFLLFTKFTGGFRTKKIKRKKQKFKDTNEDIFLTGYLKKIIMIMFVMSLAVSLLSYFFIDGVLSWILIIMSMFVIGFGIVKLYQLKDFKEDKLIIIIGRQKEAAYQTVLNKKSTKLNIKDVYHNEDYIIDRFATVHIYENKKLIEKHYLYWIATSQVFEISNPNFKKISLGYQSHIDNLMKYHDAIIKLNKHRLSYEVIKETKFRK